MIMTKFRLLLFYLIFINPPDNKAASGLVTGKMQFYRSKYFDERSIHADIGRDMNVVCNHVKAFSAGKQNKRDNDLIKYDNDMNVDNQHNDLIKSGTDTNVDNQDSAIIKNVNVENEVSDVMKHNNDVNIDDDVNINQVKDVMIDTEGVNIDSRDIDETLNYKSKNIDAGINYNGNIVENEKFDEKKFGNVDSTVNPIRLEELETIQNKNNVEQSEKQNLTRTASTESNKQISLTSASNDKTTNDHIYKREIVESNPRMETESRGNMVEKRNRQSQTAPLEPQQSKRLINCHKQFITPEETFRKKNSQIVKHDMKSLDDVHSENQYQNNYLAQSSNRPAKMNSENPQLEAAPQTSYQPFQENHAGMDQQGMVSELNEPDIKEHPMISRLFAKQRQIENLKQLLMQVESKFQMEVNEVGRLQQSVAEAERELDEAVHLMQDVKMRNIKGLQHIEAAQDAAGRNLESKALKAHAEESQLAMHDQVLFSERQRLNALRAQMIYLQTELAAAQNSGILTFDDGEKNGFQSYGFHYKNPSLSESLKYFPNSQNKQAKSYSPYRANDAPDGSSDSNGIPQKNAYMGLISDGPS